MKKSNIIAYLILGLLFIQSCSKKENDPAPAPSETKSDILIKNKWKFYSWTADGVDATEEYVDECEKDNIFTFFENGTYTSEDKGISCDDGPVYQGTWKLIDNETKIVDNGETRNIEELTNSKFSASFMDEGKKIVLSLVPIK